MLERLCHYEERIATEEYYSFTSRRYLTRSQSTTTSTISSIRILHSVHSHYVSDAETTRSILFDKISRGIVARYLQRADYDALIMHTLDMLHYVGMRSIEEITTRYGPLTRTVQGETTRYNYEEHREARAQVLHQGRNLNMVSTYGS